MARKKEKPHSVDIALAGIQPRKLPSARLDKPMTNSYGDIVYRPHFNEMAYNMTLLGYTMYEMAKAFGVDVKVIETWKNIYPAFKQSIDDAGPKVDAIVARAMLSRAIGYEHEATRKVVNRDGTITEVTEVIKFAPDVTAGFKWLNARQRRHWSERTEVTGANGGPIDVVHTHIDADPQEAAKIYQNMIQAAKE